MPVLPHDNMGTFGGGGECEDSESSVGWSVYTGSSVGFFVGLFVGFTVVYSIFVKYKCETGA